MPYRFDDFQACLNQTFVLSAGDYTDELELIRIDRLDQRFAHEGNEAFSIVFQSSKPDAIAQQTYHMTNEQLGELDLFIVPIAQDESGVRYEAVFS